MALNLDIKASAPTVKPYEEPLARLLAEHAHTDRVIVASFLDHATDTFAQLAPDIATSAGTFATANFWRACIRATSCPTCPMWPCRFRRNRVTSSWWTSSSSPPRTGCGLAVHVWTVNDADEMARLVDLGVDGVITDRPSTLVELLAQRGVAYRA